ncbi:hypothetical protein [Tenacibaculum ovolyticum]|uniref:hypothetical protein n=1 Tax=Tenacibaculum ovolyticum TaxID=104270 RepID=UPI0004273200|nr:hypothetical protein [Tenacibaculum ovolyticum]
MIRSSFKKKKTEDYSILNKEVNQEDFTFLLKEQIGTISHDLEKFLVSPIMITTIERNKYSRLSSLLNEVFEKVVLNYFKDKDIRETYRLDAGLESILKLTEGAPYKVGMYRPDFIFDKRGVPKICEIGCRYPINGWMISYHVNEVLSKLEIFTKHSNVIPEQLDFIPTILKDLDINKTLFYVHDKEKGTEAHSFFKKLSEKGFSIADISFNDLKLVNGELEVNNEKAVQFILEMDREELKNKNPEILKALIKADTCINDLRSIILIHDKRILSVLYNEAIMTRYISEEDYVFLKQFLIPSFTLNSKKIRDQLINADQNNWILKRSSGGRGIGMYEKNNCSESLWKKVVTEQWADYMVQEYISQKELNISYKGDKQTINVVGMLLAYNEQSFGLGIYRGSTESIINVHSGAYVFPSVIAV